MTFDAGDPGSVSERKTKIKHRQEQVIEDMRATLATEHGRAVLWRILANCGLNDSYDSAPPPVPVAYANEGRRKIGIGLILAIEEASPGAYARMQLEMVKKDS
jgi:hypothetical protein